ncbi:MAG: rhamnan synthesis F family protein [Hyphomicrobiales bacterium]|nr:rhamnan synthesis F family protein [Hyphomicrobiales bacterium]
MAFFSLTGDREVAKPFLRATKASFSLNALLFKTMIRAAHHGALPLRGRNFAVFVTFTEMPYVAEYVYRHLDFLNANNFNVIVVSNSKKINEQSLRELKARSLAVLERPNVGYDFGAYRDGVLWVAQHFEASDRLLLLNDSVFGPINIKSDLFSRAFSLDADIIGLLESMEHRYHFQSFWILFNRNVTASQKFVDYWRSVPYYKDKLSVVEKLETRILNYFLQADFRSEAIFQVDVVTRQAMAGFMREIDQIISASAGRDSESLEAPARPEPTTPAERLRASQRGTPLRARLDYLRQIVGILNHGVPMNPSVFMWRTLLQEFQFPYIKREIFTRNPVSEPNILSAYDVTAACGYPVELVRSYLRGAR